MVSPSIAAALTGRITGALGRVVGLLAVSLLLWGAVLVAGAGPAAGLASLPAEEVPRPVGQSTAPQVPPMNAREFGIPLAFLAGIGIFLVISSRAGSQASKLADAPLKPGGSLRFPEMNR